METTHATLAPPAPKAGEAQPYRWTRAQYDRLSDLGLFAGRRVELLGGEILEMSPKRPPHRVATERARRALATIFPEASHTIWDQASLALSEWDEPEPDLVVVQGRPEDALAGHPTASQALLVIEIADTTVAYDTGPKADRYAAAGIADYWVVDLPARMVEVCRAPAPRPESETRVRYAARQRYGPSEAIAPLAAADRPVSVAALLPPR